MKKFILMIHIFLAIWALDSWTTVASAQTSTSACTSKYLIGFFNGVRVTPDDAIATQLRLRDEFPATHKGKPLGITRFYNPADRLYGDLAESFKQATKGNPALQQKWELILLSVHGKNKFLSFINLSTGDMDFINTLLVDVWAKKIAEFLPGKVEQTLIKKMQDYMDQKVAVVAVAHSQGNFFADAVHKAIGRRQVTEGFTVNFVHVAPPLGPALMHGAYFLNTSDIVINKVRELDSSVPKGNLNMDIDNITEA